jgi:hypothetical protein
MRREPNRTGRGASESLRSCAINRYGAGCSVVKGGGEAEAFMALKPGKIKATATIDAAGKREFFTVIP